MENIIEVQGVTKRFGQVVALDNVSFQVKKGEVLGLLGPNAAGKTTTMRILTGYFPPTRGDVRVCGYDIFDQPLEVKSRVGYMPEHPPVYKDMSVVGYLSFVSQIKGVPSRERKNKIEKVLTTAGLQEVRNKIISHLSRGYQQRVGLAQALLQDPELLILDEPTIGLDPRQIIEVRNLIKSLGGERTVLLSSHILPEVSQVCERVVIINEGKVVAVDTQEELSNRVVGSFKLYIEVKGPQEEVAEEIKSIAGVNRVELTKEQRPLFGYIIECARGKDIREELFSRMVEKRWPILELRKTGVSLEEVFLKLTTEEET